MAASDKDLGDLHAAVATKLKSLVEDEPTAAVLGAAIAFLKNNNITASPTDNAALVELSASLAAKRASRKMSAQQLREAEELFRDVHGGGLQ